MVEFTADDEGKVVLDSEGEELGVVTEVRTGAAFVEPLPDLEGPTMAALGWGGDDRDAYRLQDDHVDAVTGSEIRLDSP